MRTKYMIIYLAVGAAFLAVSLWAFLSNGKSARAIRYKYKLGGILLTASAMLSAASCEGGPPTVTCYEPVVTCYDVAMESDVITLEFKGKTIMSIRNGDVLVINVKYASYEGYRCRITAEPEGGDPYTLQETEFKPEDGSASAEMTIAAGSYTGPAKALVYGFRAGEDGKEIELQLYSMPPFTLY